MTAIWIVATAALILLAHVALGWMWTVPAAALGGLVAARHGWLVGAGGAATAWGGLVAYSVVVAPGATEALLDTLGSLAGNIPGVAVVAVTVVLGGLLGGLGGSLGSLVRPVLRSTSSATRR